DCGVGDGLGGSGGVGIGCGVGDGMGGGVGDIIGGGGDVDVGIGVGVGDGIGGGGGDGIGGGGGSQLDKGVCFLFEYSKSFAENGDTSKTLSCSSNLPPVSSLEAKKNTQQNLVQSSVITRQKLA
ncbi:hypothetical protein Tco_0230706, partial [Tanacetum coccineum]